jgi:hypothetical protein
MEDAGTTERVVHVGVVAALVEMSDAGRIAGRMSAVWRI